MDRAKLAELRKKSLDSKQKKHQELLDLNISIRDAVLALNESLNKQEPYDDAKLVAQLKDLKDSQTFSEDVKRLEKALNSLSNEKKLDDVIKAVGNINNQDVVAAVNGLMAKLEENTPDQVADNFQPVRRVIKVGTKLLFDDTPTPNSIAVGGGGGGGGKVQPALIRNGNSIAVVNPDGTPISGSGGGGGDATAANQVTGNNSLASIDAKVATEDKQDDQIETLESIDAGIDEVTAAIEALPPPQTDALTDTQLRATPVPVSGTVTSNQQRGATTTTSSVNDAATVQTLQVSNSSRIKVVIVNNSTSTLYIKEGPAASLTDWTYRLEQYDTVIIDDYTGIVTGIWSADSTGNAKVSETA